MNPIVVTRIAEEDIMMTMIAEAAMAGNGDIGTTDPSSKSAGFGMVLTAPIFRR